MAWPVDFDDPTREGLVLVPSEAALVQDLGPFRSGRNFETDLLPGSALVCAAENGEPCVGEDGIVRFAFEGNAIDAVNLRRFHEKVVSAAGRLSRRSASIAYGSAKPEELTPVAGVDLLRTVFTHVIDTDALEHWAGEPISGFLPPADLETPSADPDVTGPLTQLPMRMLVNGEHGIHLWTLMDGSILSMEPSRDRLLTVWRSGDDGFDDLMKRAGLELSERFKMDP